MHIATFAAGCFWGVEYRFSGVEGVVETEVGYTGGTLDHPGYDDVCSGRSGHAEAVRIQYDPAKVSYDELLEVFWACHDPTQLNRQGPDIGTQYRSAIYVHDAEQRRSAEASLARMGESGRYQRPIVTEIAEAGPFWRAEDKHQKYIERTGVHACHM